MNPDQLILVIENDHETRVLVRSSLEQKGYTVVSAATGTDALSQLKNITTPALVLLGSDSPLSGAEDFLRHVSQNPHYSTMSIIQMSRNPDFRLAGTDCQLSNPPVVDDLLSVVGLFIKQKAKSSV
jgi:CheY-like chemotaxis protein